MLPATEIVEAESCHAARRLRHRFSYVFAGRDGYPTTGWSSPVGALVSRPPVKPGKVIGVGRNFRAHAAEMGNEPPAEPLLFFKPSTALITDGDAIVLPGGYERIDMEAELVVVIGSGGRNLQPSEALEAVLGYTVGNDVSCRDLQRRERGAAQAAPLRQPGAAAARL